MPTKNEKFPSAPQAFFLVLALLLVEYVVGAALYDSRHALDLSPNELDAFVTLLGNAIFFTILLHICGMTYRDLFHTSRSSVQATLFLLLPPIVLLIPALVLGATALTEALVSVFPLSRWEEQVFERMGANNLPSIIATCVLAPVLEEMLFRGIILRAFLRQYTRWGAIFASALLFGFAHMNIYQFVVAFVLGILAGWLYERAQSLVPCIALHACYNSSLVVLDLADSSESAQSPSGGSLASWSLALVAAGVGARVLRRLLPTKARSAT